MIALALAVALLAGGTPEYGDLVGPVVKYAHAGGSGTAFAIDKDKLMTAAHLVPREGESWICYGVRPCKHRAVKVLKIDRKLDLAVLEVKDHGIPPVKWRPGAPPRDLETVWIVGRPANKGVVPLRGYMAGRDPDMPQLYRIVGPTYPGMSGGPVYDEKGRVIGVMSMAFIDRGHVVQFLAFVVPVKVVNLFRTEVEE